MCCIHLVYGMTYDRYRQIAGDAVLTSVGLAQALPNINAQSYNNGCFNQYESSSKKRWKTCTKQKSVFLKKIVYIIITNALQLHLWPYTSSFFCSIFLQLTFVDCRQSWINCSQYVQHQMLLCVLQGLNRVQGRWQLAFNSLAHFSLVLLPGLHVAQTQLKISLQLWAVWSSVDFGTFVAGVKVSKSCHA